MPGNAGVRLRSETEQDWYSISSGFLCLVAPDLYCVNGAWELARTLAVQKPAGVYHTSLFE